MRRAVGRALLLVFWLVYLYASAHLSVAALRSHDGELGQSLDLTLTGARWLAASLAPLVVGLVLYLRRPVRRRALEVQHAASLPAPPAPSSSFVSWHRQPQVG